MVRFNHSLLEFLLFGCVVLLDLVDLAHLSDSLEEFISRARLLWLEEGEPENLGIQTPKSCTDIFCQGVVDNVLEVNGVKLIGPGMKDLEALVVHVLESESLNVLFNEFEVSLIRLNGIAQIVLVDRFFVISQERTNCFNA